jgi:hypothetical protein
MDSPLPTRESFLLGAKLGPLCSHHTCDVLTLAKESIQLLETMTSIEQYQRLVLALHTALHHNPDIFGECHVQQHALASIMSQMFAAGYAAGRQEIIDGELRKMAASA